MLTWWLLNENDTNEINTDSTWSFVNTHCLCSVLKVESLYSFSPTIGKKAFIVLTYRKCFILFLVMAKFKQACFAHDLSKKFQIFAAVHFLCLKHRGKASFPKLSLNLRAYQLSNLRFHLSFLLPFSSNHQGLAVDLHAHENIWF